MEAVAEKLENQTAATQAMREQLETQSAELAAARASKNELASEVASLRSEKEATSHALLRQQSAESSGVGSAIMGSGIKRATGSGRLARVGVTPKHDLMATHSSIFCVEHWFAGLPGTPSLVDGCNYYFIETVFRTNNTCSSGCMLAVLMLCCCSPLLQLQVHQQAIGANPKLSPAAVVCCDE